MSVINFTSVCERMFLWTKRLHLVGYTVNIWHSTYHFCLSQIKFENHVTYYSFCLDPKLIDKIKILYKQIVIKNPSMTILFLRNRALRLFAQIRFLYIILANITAALVSTGAAGIFFKLDHGVFLYIFRFHLALRTLFR